MAWDNEKKKVKTAVAVAYEPGDKAPKILASRSEEHTSELQSHGRRSYAVFCLKKKKKGQEVV